jgi:WD40 repeat protein
MFMCRRFLGGIALIPLVLWQSARSEPPPAKQRAEDQAKEWARTDALGDPLPYGAILRIGTTRLRHPQCHNAVAFSPNGKEIASAGPGAVIFWDPETGKEIRRFTPGGNRGYSGLAFSPDGKILALAGYDGNVYICESATGKELQRFLGGADTYIMSVAFSPNGKAVVAGGSWKVALRVWELETGKEAVKLELQEKANFQSVAYGPLGKTIAAAGPRSGGKGQSIHLWDATTGKHLWEAAGPTQNTAAISFSRDGKILAAGGSGGPIHRYDPETGKEDATLGDPAYAIAFSPKQDILAGGNTDGSISLWDPITSKEVRKLKGHPAWVKVLSFSPDGKTLASCGDDESIRVWDVGTGKELHPSPWHEYHVMGVSYLPGGKTLASISGDQTVRLWDATTGKELHQFDLGRFLPPGRIRSGGAEVVTTSFYALALSPDGKTLGARACDRSFHFWDTTTGKALELFRSKEKPAQLISVVYLPDGKSVIKGDAEGIARVWDVASGEQERELDLQKDAPQRRKPANHFAVVRDGKIVATQCANSVYLWEPDKGTVVNKYDFKHDWFHARAMSEDGQTLVYEADNQLVLARFGDTDDGQPTFTRSLGRRQVFGVAFSADGKLLAITPQDLPGVSLWEVATNQEVARLEGHRHTVCGVAFSPDGRRLASGSRDATILVWDLLVSPKEVLKALTKPLGDKELANVWADLGSEEARTAYRAVSTLTALPEPAVKLLNANLRPSPDDGKRVQHLLADLDDKDFDVREKASRELKALGRKAGPALREALKSPAGEEARRRMEELIAGVKALSRQLSREELRQSRSVLVLERLGTKPAREVLKTLADGDPADLQTRDAAAALRRPENPDSTR